MGEFEDYSCPYLLIYIDWVPHRAAMDESGPAIVLEPVGQAMDERSYSTGFEIESNQEARHRFREFFRNFRQEIYTHIVKLWYGSGIGRITLLRLIWLHVNEYDEKLFNNLQSKPIKSCPFSN